MRSASGCTERTCRRRYGTEWPAPSRSRRGFEIGRRISLDILFTIAAVLCDGSRGEVDIVRTTPARHDASRNSGNVLFPAWSVRSAATSASRSNGGISTVPEANAAPMVTTGPSSVKYKL
jgi:hypothetical protein